MATGAQCIPITTDTGAGTPALMMDVSPAMSAWLVNVRVVTRDCQGWAEIVTDRKLAGSRCSAAVRTGSQAASAVATIRTVPWDSWISATANSATSRPGSGAGRIVPADSPGARPPRPSGVRASMASHTDAGSAGASRVSLTRTQPGCSGALGWFSGGGSLAR